MKARIRIITQREENYGFYEGKSHWKMKGGTYFNIEADSDFIMYSEKRTLIDAIETLLKKESNDLERFTYIEHEVLFQKERTLHHNLEEQYLLIKK